MSLRTLLKTCFSIERLGIQPVPPHEQTARPLALFWLWCAANIGMLALVYGAIIMSFELSFLQALLVMCIGLSSFFLVGIVSLAGFKGRTNTLTLSRRVFGTKGNIIPTLLGWFYLMGWECINLVAGTLTLKTLCVTIGLPDTLNTLLIAFISCALLIGTIGLLGLKAVMSIQKWCTALFGGLTLYIMIYIMLTSDWSGILALPAGSWLNSFLPATTVIIAGTGMGWTIAAADYSRTQDPSTSQVKIIGAVVIGASLPLFILMLAGILLSLKVPELSISQNPFIIVGSALPQWMSIPYLFAAMGSVISLGILSLYSASLNFLSLGIKIPQYKAVIIDATIVLTSSAYILLVAQDFLALFVPFLLLCGLMISGWAAIFIVDFLYQPYYLPHELSRPHIAPAPIFCWLIGIFIGMSMSKTPFFQGFLAIGLFEKANIGLIATFTVSGLLYAVYRKFYTLKEAV